MSAASTTAPLAIWRDALLAVALVSGVPLVGLLALAWRGTLVRRWAPQAAAVAVGALTGAALFQLLPEAYARHPDPRLVPLTVAAGCAAFFVLEWVLHGLHDHHGDEHGHAHGPHVPHTHAAPDGRASAWVRLAIAGDALHNLVDGALIAATFLADPRAGVLTTAAVALHEIPRELGTFGAVVHGGVSARRAVAYNAATALAAGAGAVVTLVAGERAARLAPVVLPFAAGNFLYLAGSLLLSLVRAGRRRPRGETAGAWALRAALVGLGLAVTAFSAH